MDYTLYRAGGLSNNGTQTWVGGSTWYGYANVYFDGVYVRCSSNYGMTWIGNGESVEVTIIGNNMLEEYDYRLMFNYEIAPVVNVG